MIPLNYNALFNILLTLSFQIMILYNDVKKKGSENFKVSVSIFELFLI